LGKADIDTMRLLRPDDATLGAFGELSQPLLELIVHQAKESRALAEMRDYLLPRLLSGDVRAEGR
jgi:type I restriction enzyme S subunit